jgi:hypothetical protein
VTDRPQNLRPTRLSDRTGNSHHHHYRPDAADVPVRDLSYRGSHRVEHQRFADDQPSSRVGHHHTAGPRDRSGRW